MKRALELLDADAFTSNLPNSVIFRLTYENDRDVLIGTGSNDSNNSRHGKRRQSLLS
jgi:hypothetical protein